MSPLRVAVQGKYFGQGNFRPMKRICAIHYFPSPDRSHITSRISNLVSNGWWRPNRLACSLQPIYFRLRVLKYFWFIYCHQGFNLDLTQQKLSRWSMKFVQGGGKKLTYTIFWYIERINKPFCVCVVYTEAIIHLSDVEIAIYHSLPPLRWIILKY